MFCFVRLRGKNLLFFSAFSFKDDLFALGVIGVASGIGGFIGVIAAPVLRRSFREEAPMRFTIFARSARNRCPSEFWATMRRETSSSITSGNWESTPTESV